MKLRTLSFALLAAAVVTLPGISAQASSHREAPNITRMPLVDGTDFYMFNSYETGRSAFVTLIANYQPLQSPYGGPNYFTMDPNALYEIHIDNNGDAVEDITFQFRFQNALADAQVDTGDGTKVSIPLSQAGPPANATTPTLNVTETYTVDVVRGDRRANAGNRQPLTNFSGGSSTFSKPVDNIGTKTIPDYATYADAHIYNVNVPGCNISGSKLFVGQRREGFAVNLGAIFDLVNVDPAVIINPANINAAAGNPGDVSDGKFNVTTLALEVPIDCLKSSPTGDDVIGGWTTASIRQGTLANGSPGNTDHRNSLKQGGAWVQVSRLGNPLVNEVVIGLKDKDKFNASEPKDDAANFATYVTNPTLPALLDIALDLTGVLGSDPNVAPTNLPRTDLLNVFLTGFAPVNKPSGTVVPSEMLRLNTKMAAVPLAQQNRLGVAGEVIKVGGTANLGSAVDLAGFPNGRRPADDVVDIALVAVEGGLCVINSKDDLSTVAAGDDNNVLGLSNFGAATSPCNFDNVPLGKVSFNLHDGVDQAQVPFLDHFPYLNTPTPGAM